mgnify:FL=1
MYHSREYKSEEKQGYVNVFYNISRLESNLKAWSYLRSNENTENCIKQPNKHVTEQSLNNHESVKNDEEDLSNEVNTRNVPSPNIAEVLDNMERGKQRSVDPPSSLSEKSY